MTSRRGRRVETAARFSAVVPAVLLLSACSSVVSPAKLDKVSMGMKTDEVTAQLGQPTRIDHAEIIGLTGDAYHYVSRQGDAQVVLINGAVFGTQFVSGGKGS